MKELFIKILRFLMFVLVVALGCIGYNIYEDTLAAVWIPVGVGLVVAVVTLPLYKKWMIASILEDAAGMAGTEVIRRTIGDSKVKEIESIESIEARVYMDKFLILLGKSLIKDRYKIKTGKDYVALIDKIKKLI